MSTAEKNGQHTTYNRLDRRQQRRAEDWLDAHWSEVERNHWTAEQTAKLASTKLGFEVTSHNMKKCASTIDRQFRKHGDASRFMGKFGKQAQAELLRLTVEIAGELGKVVPPILTETLAALQEERAQ